VSGGTDNHLMLVDLRDVHPDLTGKQAEKWLEDAGIITNKNMIPFDERKPTETSGLRLGTPALTTRGLGQEEMKTVAELLHAALSSEGDEATIKKVNERVREMCAQFPVAHA
ncbi:MAG: serine hydroxymethyltransferase, partial [Phycisphaerae bacterium]|nr:serine hydroxymethyltransferase [Phycisphaerae bacterium]